MNQYVTGAVIRELREKKGMTQADLAQRLFVSDKTVSKWENGKGYPDISLLDPIAKLFGVSIAELVSGEVVRNINVSGNMLRSKFYVCPVCGNVIHTMGEAAISCHGVQLTPAQPEETDENHMIFVEGVEDEYYVRIEHDMTKTHYISFVAALSPDRLQLVKLYPEGNAEARFQVRGVKQLFFYCNRDGLFRLNVKPSIDARRASYDDTAHRRALEQTAASIFG
ncbi:MAG: helix-turn-helix domain-containing protein [Clostridia bacterium]|nr:helix-turn-helix domain-containing protein [Clostridia bacterium]